MADRALVAPTKNVVVQSINLDGETRCVDVYRRPDGTFGFAEYRRDPEDGRGWFAIGGNPAQVFGTEAEALAAARRAVTWLASSVGAERTAGGDQ